MHIYECHHKIYFLCVPASLYVYHVHAVTVEVRTGVTDSYEHHAGAGN